MPLGICCSKDNCPCTESCHKTSLEINHVIKDNKRIHLIKNARTVDIARKKNMAGKEFREQEEVMTLPIMRVLTIPKKV